MANYSICGIDCDACKFKTEQNCLGCKTIEGKVFWGECDLYKCNSNKKQEHCGKCSKFPCDMLRKVRMKDFRNQRQSDWNDSNGSHLSRKEV